MLAEQIIQKVNIVLTSTSDWYIQAILFQELHYTLSFYSNTCYWELPQMKESLLAAVHTLHPCTLQPFHSPTFPLSQTPHHHILHTIIFLGGMGHLL